MSHPNVVLVVMDTARASDVCGAHNGQPITPELESLANEGIKYSNVHAPAPWTLPSHASLFTGTPPSKHGAHADHKRLDDQLPTIAEIFTDAGYESVAVSNNTWISEEFGFGRGFERFHKTWQYVQSETDLGRIAREYDGITTFRALGRALFDGNPAVNLWNAVYGRFFRKRHDDGAQRTNEWIRDWLTGRDGRPFFLFINYLEPHLPYEPPKEYADPFLPETMSFEEATSIPQDPWAYIAGKRHLSSEDFEGLRALYRGELGYLDSKLGELRSMLREQNVWEETVFVVTGDHGENIGDHGLMDHQYCLYETLTHVPLIVRGGPFTSGERSDELIQLTDLFPTLLDTAEIDAASARSGSQGTTFHPDKNTEPRDAVFSEYLAPQPSMAALENRIGALPERVHTYDRRLRAIRTEQYKLIRGSDGSRELYDVKTDPSETTNIAAAHPERIDTLENRLDSWLTSFEHSESTTDVDMSPETRARLEDLGYLQ